MKTMHYGFLIINSKGKLKMFMKLVQFQDVLKQLLFNKASVDKLSEEHISELITPEQSYVHAWSFRLLEEEKELRPIANTASGSLSKYLMVDFDSTTTMPGSGTKWLLCDASEDQVDMTLS